MTSKIHLITGGSRGIGRAIVERLARDGHRVVFSYHTSREAAEQLARACGDRVSCVPLDVLDPASCESVVSSIERDVGPLFGVVNNAGVLRESLLALTSDKQWDEVLETNLGGVFRVCRATLPPMMQRREGSIVNIASLSSIRGLPGQAAYAASKAGILGLTRSLAREVGRRGIRVNALLPGFVATDLTQEISDASVEKLRALEALPQPVTGDDVASAVAFLLSGSAASITGQAIPVDGGASI